MKQGSARTVQSGHKAEPKSMAINPGYAGQIGAKLGNHATEDGQTTGTRAVEKMHQGRGYSAPKAAGETHHCGTQGKH